MAHQRLAVERKAAEVGQTPLALGRRDQNRKWMQTGPTVPKYSTPPRAPAGGAVVESEGAREERNEAGVPPQRLRFSQHSRPRTCKQCRLAGCSAKALWHDAAKPPASEQIGIVLGVRFRDDVLQVQVRLPAPQFSSEFSSLSVQIKPLAKAVRCCFQPRQPCLRLQFQPRQPCLRLPQASHFLGNGMAWTGMAPRNDQLTGVPTARPTPTAVLFSDNDKAAGADDGRRRGPPVRRVDGLSWCKLRARPRPTATSPSSAGPRRRRGAPFHGTRRGPCRGPGRYDLQYVVPAGACGRQPPTHVDLA